MAKHFVYILKNILTSYTINIFLPVLNNIIMFVSDRFSVLRSKTLRYVFVRGSRRFIFNYRWHHMNKRRGRSGRDRMVVGFTTTYLFRAYHH